MKIGSKYVYPDKDLEGARIVGASFYPGGFLITYKRRRARKSVTVMIMPDSYHGGINITPFMAEGEQ